MSETLPLHRMLDSEPAAEAPPRDLQQILTEIGMNALLFLLIFGMAGTVDIRNLKRQLHNRYAIITGICMQFIVMPFLGFIAVISLKPYGLTTSMGITLLIVTASPGGSYSNWWCSLFNADLALSVAMTALSTMLSIGLLPANLMLYAHAAYGFNSSDEQNVLKSVDFFALMISLVIVISAILTGLLVSFKSESSRFRRASNALGSISGLALIVVSALVSANGGDEDGQDSVKPWDQHWSFYVGVSFPCVAGLIIANILAKFARLEDPEVVTLSVECCYQNVGIATSAVLSMFQDKDEIARAMAVPLFYGLVEAGLLGLYCMVSWKLGWTKAPKDEQVCVVLTKTYEVVEDEEDDENDQGADVEEQNKKESDVDSRTISMAPTISSLNSSKPDETEEANEITPISPSVSQEQLHRTVSTGARGEQMPSRAELSDDLSYETGGGVSSSFSFEESFRTIGSAVSNIIPFRRTASGDDPSPYQIPEKINNSSSGAFTPRDISYMSDPSQENDDTTGDKAQRDRLYSDITT